MRSEECPPRSSTTPPKTGGEYRGDSVFMRYLVPYYLLLVTYYLFNRWFFWFVE